MALDRVRVRAFARSYTDAWCSHDPARVADHYVPGGTIAINGGEPTEVPRRLLARPLRPDEYERQLEHEAPEP